MCDVFRVLLLMTCFWSVQLGLDSAAHPQSSETESPGSPTAAARGAVLQAGQASLAPEQAQTVQHAPATIPALALAVDSSGSIGTWQPGGAPRTATNPFFQNLGTNGRTCFTCHQPQNGWSLTPTHVRRRFVESHGADPVFRLVDGATCPTADVSTQQAQQLAYRLLLTQGLFRIALPLPPTPATVMEYQVLSVQDPYACTMNPQTGLTSFGADQPAVGMVSVYRRPLPATNLGFLSTVMWDGREASLATQAVDATLGHAQAQTTPTPTQVQQIVTFESDLFTAQAFDVTAGLLQGHHAAGGPIQLAQQPFYLGINDPLGNNPTGAPFSSTIFTLYAPWLTPTRESAIAHHRASIARGEQLFNTKAFDITGVGGLNDVLGQEHLSGFCGTCHDTPNVGNHSIKAPLNIGIADPAPPGLEVAALPIFTLQCIAGPLAGEVFRVTDPGRALISGKCADIGKFKGPILRGLAARAPYFHNGSAKTLAEVVHFYDRRFHLELTDQEKTDLVNFLKAL